MGSQKQSHAGMRAGMRAGMAGSLCPWSYSASVHPMCVIESSGGIEWESEMRGERNVRGVGQH